MRIFSCFSFSELKRRLSSSSVENEDDEDDYDESDRIDEEKLKRAVEQLDTYDKDSSIAHVIKQNLEALKKQRFVQMPFFTSHPDF